jgi:hypothetical protein
VVAWVAAVLPLLVLGCGGRRRQVRPVAGLALLIGYAAYVALVLT